jgi:YegS/Rv2252/BmrU family lipid kinase
MTTLLTLANPGAGSATDEAVDSVLAVLRESCDVELATTQTPSELDSALSEHPDVDGVIVLGGDGSLHAVVAALHRAGRLRDTFVGLIPLGTGNDFARTLDLPDAPDEAARRIGPQPARDLDLIIDGQGRVVVNVAHIGIGAEAAAVSQPLKRVFGPFGYVAGALVTTVKALSTPGADLKVRIDGQPLPDRGRILQVAVGNGRFVGGGTALLPDADPSDGRLDVAVTYAAPLPHRIVYAWQLSRRDHHRRDEVVYRQGSTVEVHGDAVPCTSDGEIIDPAADHSWRIEPAAMRMWV